MPPILTPPTSADIDTQAIQTFVTRVRAAARTNSKEIRMPATDASDLVAAMLHVLAQNVALSQQVKAQERTIAEGIKMDGGSFS